MVSKNTLLEELPPYKGEVLLLSENQTVGKIVREIAEAHKAFANQYDNICKFFDYSTPYEIAAALFDFCKKNIPYIVEDDEVQSTRSPAGILQLAGTVGTDCKHYASFIGGTIDALQRECGRQLDWFYRFASYERDPSPGHVFVVLIDEDGSEIWIDPVLHKLNQRYPYPKYILDKNPNMLVRMSGVETQRETNIRQRRIGATVIQAQQVQSTGMTGQAKIETTAAALEVVGTALDATVVGSVAGVIVNAVGGIVAAAGKLWGSTWKDDSLVRWLIQNYQFYVLGQANVTSDNQVTEADLQAAYNWFFAVIGIPLYDVGTLHIIAGVGGDSRPQAYSYEERAARYLSYPEIAKLAVDVTIEQAIEAAHLADQFFWYTDPPKYSKTAPAGAWKNFPVAQYWIDLAAQNQPSVVPVNSVDVVAQKATTTPAKNNVWLWVALGAAVIGGIVLSSNKNKKHA